MNNFPIIELFTSIQGEGVFMGIPSVFVRVTGCNLRCCFKNSICDTPYSSYNPEKPKYTIQDVVRELIKYPNVSHLVITGGEPALYNITEFLNELEKELKKSQREFPKVTIETNGSLNINPDPRIWLYSISPKLSTSCFPEQYLNEESIDFSIGDDIIKVSSQLLKNHNKNRINVPILASTILNGFRVGIQSQLKFVWSGSEIESEILELLDQLAGEISNLQKKENHSYSVPWDYDLEDPRQFLNNCVFLMPEGISPESLNNTANSAVDACIRNGWNYTDRLHIRIWNNLRNK